MKWSLMSWNKSSNSQEFQIITRASVDKALDAYHMTLPISLQNCFSLTSQITDVTQNNRRGQSMELQIASPP